MKKIGWKIRYFSTHDLHRFSPQPCYIKIPVLICRGFFVTIGETKGGSWIGVALFVFTVSLEISQSESCFTKD